MLNASKRKDRVISSQTASKSLSGSGSWHDQRRVLFHLGLPIFLETFLRMLIGNVNVFMISQLSDGVVGAVGVANQIINFSLMVYMTIGFGTAVLISQNLGAGKRHVAMDVANTAITLSVVTGLGMGLTLMFAAPGILTLLRVPGDMMSSAVSYLRIVGGASVFQAAIGVMSAIARNYRYARIPLIITLGMNGMNLIGNMVVVFRPFGLPDFGVVGIATAAAISQMTAAVVMFVLLFAHKGMNLTFSIPRPFPLHTVGRILAIGVPGGGDSLFYSLMMIATTYIITGMGPDALTAAVYMQSLISFVQVLGFSVGQATMIQTGHLVGAGRNKEAYQFCMRSHWLAIALNGSVCVTFFLLSRQLLGIFTDNPAIIAIGVSVFFVDLFLEPGRPWNMVVGTALRATGDVVYPVVVSILSLWCVCVPLAWLLGAKLGFGLPGVYAAYAVDEYVRGGLMYIRLRSGVWKKKRVVEDGVSLA